MAKFRLRQVAIKTASLARCFLFGLIACLLLMNAGCESPVQRSMFILSGPIMGTDYRITVVSDSNIDQEALHQDLLSVMNAVNGSMSHYDPSSELSKINVTDAGEAVSLSDSLNQVLIEAFAISELSNGAFDVTLGPIIDLWGFGVQGSITQRPSLIEMKKISESIGYSRLSLNNSVLIKSHSDTQLNLSAIAKGFAVDQVALALEQRNIHDYLVNIGGELRASGSNIDQNIWRVGIEKPELLGGIQQVVKLDNAAIATSGDYLNFLVFDKQRYSHTIDPISLAPVLHKLASVSVIHQNASTADAMATAIMAMGEERGFEFAELQQLAAYFVVRNDAGEGIHILQTTKLAVYIDE